MQGRQEELGYGVSAPSRDKKTDALSFWRRRDLVLGPSPVRLVTLWQNGVSDYDEAPVDHTKGMGMVDM